MYELQKFLDSLAYRDTKKLLVDLAINFSEKTKRVVVPSGTTQYICEILSGRPFASGIKTIQIPLIPFFGMYVGYNSELDVLVFEEPKR